MLGQADGDGTQFNHGHSLLSREGQRQAEHGSFATSMTAVPLRTGRPAACKDAQRNAARRGGAMGLPEDPGDERNRRLQ